MKKEVVLDILGRVCIPKKYLHQLGWKTTTKDHQETVFVELKDDKVIITGENYKKKCPKCSKAFSDNYTFCPYCGKELKDDENGIKATDNK